MSQVLYARVPDDLKVALDAYAEEKAQTLTRAVVDLLGRGLAAETDESSIRALEDRLAAEVGARRLVEAALDAARMQQSTLELIRRRTEQRVGECVDCGAPISGLDVLASARCEQCGAPLRDTLAPATEVRGTDQRDLLLLLGAIGALLGAAWVAGRSA